MQKDFFKNLSNELRNNHSGKKSYAPTFLNEAVIQKKQVQSAPSDTWEILESPKRLSRTYTFDVDTRVKEFVNEMIDYHGRYHHAGDIQINQNSVLVEVYTKDLNNLTELDYEYTKAADAIYRDTGFYHDKF